MSNFFLYVFLPGWNDSHRERLSFGEEQISAFEKSEMRYAKLECVPDANTSEAKSFFEGVVGRMTTASEDMLVETYKTREEYNLDRSLVRLMQKTFKAGEQIIEAEYNNFLAQFFAMFADEKCDAYQELQLVKADLKTALLGE